MGPLLCSQSVDNLFDRFGHEWELRDSERPLCTKVQVQKEQWFFFGRGRGVGGGGGWGVSSLGGWGAGMWQILFCGVVELGSMVGKEEESKRGSCGQTAKRLAMIRSLLHVAGNERQRNYLRRNRLTLSSW